MSTPQDIWAQLARLDQCCDVTMHSLNEPVQGVAGAMRRREWQVVIRSRAGPGRDDPVTVRAVSLSEAIVRALSEAQARGMVP